MKKSFKKILFTILTVFAVFFVVACGNKEDAKINKEEVLQKSVEANSNIKSGNKLVNAKIEVEGEGNVEFTIDTSIIKEPLAMKAIIEQKNENTQMTTYIKDGMVYATTGNNDWQKETLSENDAENFKDSLDSSIEMNEILKDHLDKVTIKEEEGNYIVSIDKDSDFLKEFLNKEVSNIVGQNIDFDPKNATVEYVIDKETYFIKSSSFSVETKIQDKKLKIMTEVTLSNINSVEEITVPEEALNSNN